MLESTLAMKFRESVAKSKDNRMKQEAKFPIQYSTGFLSFDFMNGCSVHVKTKDKDFSYYSIGIRDGCMAMIIGRSGCGKTTFAIQTAANIVRPFPTATIFHDDIEAGINARRRRQLTGFSEEEIDDRYIIRDSGITAENFYERIHSIYEMKMADPETYEYDSGLYDEHGNRLIRMEPTVYILDSIALLMPEKFTEEEELSGSMSSTAAAKTNSLLFKRITPMLKAANIILIMINHITDTISINPYDRKKAAVSYLGANESLPGGHTIVYLTDLLIRFDDNTKLKEDEAFGVNGSLVDVKICKSRNGRAGQVCTLVFDQDNGFDPELSLFVMLKEAKLINGAGAYLYIGDHNEYKFAQKNFKEMLRENEEFRSIFIKTAADYLKSNVPSYQDNEMLEHLNIQNEFMQEINGELLA